jgi:hypothetical protein
MRIPNRTGDTSAFKAIIKLRSPVHADLTLRECAGVAEELEKMDRHAGQLKAQESFFCCVNIVYSCQVYCSDKWTQIVVPIISRCNNSVRFAIYNCKMIL